MADAQRSVAGALEAFLVGGCAILAFSSIGNFLQHLYAIFRYSRLVGGLMVAWPLLLLLLMGLMKLGVTLEPGGYECPVCSLAIEPPRSFDEYGCPGCGRRFWVLDRPKRVFTGREVLFIFLNIVALGVVAELFR